MSHPFHVNVGVQRGYEKAGFRKIKLRPARWLHFEVMTNNPFNFGS